MTKKDFELIAEVLNKSDLDDASVEELARSFADALQQTNPRFDRERFIEACLEDSGDDDEAVERE